MLLSFVGNHIELSFGLLFLELNIGFIDWCLHGGCGVFVLWIEFRVELGGKSEFPYRWKYVGLFRLMIWLKMISFLNVFTCEKDLCWRTFRYCWSLSDYSNHPWTPILVYGFLHFKVLVNYFINHFIIDEKISPNVKIA